MIERVARALHESACKQDVNGYLDAKIDCAVMARAAIEAMRIPTQAMLDAGGMTYGTGYVAAIDAALSEGKEE